MEMVASSSTDFAAKDKSPPPEADLKLFEVLRVRLTEARDLPMRGASDRSIFCLVRLDGLDIYQSAILPKSINPFFGDEFAHEVHGNFGQVHFILCEQYNGRVPRPFGRVSLRKNDIIKYSGQDMWFTIKALNRESEVSGKICLEINYLECINDDSSLSPSIRLTVVDHKDLNIPSGTRPLELYLLVTFIASGHRLETKKLRVPTRNRLRRASTVESETVSSLSMGISDVTLDLSSLTGLQESIQRCQLRLSLWHDLLGGFNSYFHGELRIQLDERTLKPRTDRQGPQWYYLKPRLSGEEWRTEEHSTSMDSANTSSRRLGEFRLSLSYTADHILHLSKYADLWALILDSMCKQTFYASPVGLIEYLPNVELENVARPLMKVFLQANMIRPFLRILYTQELSRCQDVNTLFRSSSLSSKVLYELMKLVGHHYMVVTLKPIIDKIFNENKNCEVNPVKLIHGQNVEQNKDNLIVYTELAFSRVVDSNHRCPQALKDTLSDLREVVQLSYPGRVDLQRLALGSFLILRFFAAALLNPKLFGLKRENADPTVSRTLVLISKLLQRLSNSVVASESLQIKERWLNEIFERLNDGKHRLAMMKFLDRISCFGGENSISGDSVNILREGWVMERFTREKRCLKLNWMVQKRRYLVLTETELYWAKSKAVQPKGRFVLSEVNQIEPVGEEIFDSKNVLRVATSTKTIYIQASNGVEMNDWLSAIQKQCRRQLMISRETTDLNQLFDVEIERELEAVHMTFLEHAEAMKHWKNALDESAPIPLDEAALPQIIIMQSESDADTSQKTSVQDQFYESLQQVLLTTLVLEKSHRDAVVRYLKQIRYGTIEHPIGDDNYLLLKSRVKDLSLENANSPTNNNTTASVC